MMDREYVILYNELFRREIIPGSENEYRVVDKLKNLFREVVDWVKVVNIPTDSWFEEECIVETSDYAFSCRVLPYVGKDVVEGNFVEAKLVEDKIVLLDNVEYPIVFIEFPEELDITKYILLDLYRLGAIAVVFYDKYSGRYRRSVVNGDENYSFKHGSPPPIPAVSIDREDYLKLKNRRVKRIL